MSNAQKRPYEVVLSAALDIVALLKPACEKIEIAGSLRRETRLCSDIELVAIPKMREGVIDLFGTTKSVSLVDEWVAANVNPTKSGQRYVQWHWLNPDVDPDEPFQVDLFLATPENWGYILCLRTGPSDFSKAMVTPAPYGLKPPTVNVRDGYVYSYPANVRLSVPDEAVLFVTWGMDYLAPQERK